MNYIKSKEWHNNVYLFFELFAQNIHMQNDKAEKFGQLIMKKACVIKLFTNLLYKLWKKIIATALYLYNQMTQVSNN